MTEDHINFIACCSVPKKFLTLDKVQTATDSDHILRGVCAAIKLNKWHYDIVKAFKHVKDELTFTSKGVVLHGTRIVLPQSLQQCAVNIAQNRTHRNDKKLTSLEVHTGRRVRRRRERQYMNNTTINNIIKYS